MSILEQGLGSARHASDLNVGVGDCSPRIPIAYTETDNRRLINDIHYYLLGVEYQAFEQRDMELYSGRKVVKGPDQMYYPAVRELGEFQDIMFEDSFAVQHKLMLSQYGAVEDRWPHAIRLARQVQDQLGIGTPEQGGIVDCRAKSLFSAWLKQRAGDLDADEVFDTVGVRITCKDTRNARKICEWLLAKNKLMDPRLFRRRIGEKHSPISDTLDTPRPNGFASIRMNFIDPRIGIYEVQIQPMTNYVIWRKYEKETYASQGASAKYGCVVESE